MKHQSFPNRSILRRATIIGLLLATSAATRAQAQTFTVLHSFTNSPDGAFPFAGLLRDAAGNLYGTTLRGGSLGSGTVFKLDPAGKETVLYSFTDTGSPADGLDPYAVPVMDAAGNLYGTTSAALALGVLGTVFKIDTAGNFTVLHFFTGSDGCCLTGGVIIDAAGNLYGTAGGGGSFGGGTVFKLDPSGNATVLYSFKGGSDGAAPAGGLIMDAVGNLYGTTGAGGSSNAGTVFKLDPSGNETVLYSFKGGNDGASPGLGSLIRDVAGNVYGTTPVGGSGACTGANQGLGGCGIVFKLDPADNETVLYSFTGSSDGAFPEAGLVMD